MTIAEAARIARANYDTALDQRDDYESVVHALLAYRQNTADTVREAGGCEVNIQDALDIFDGLVVG